MVLQFSGGLLVELQRHVNLTKMAVGFLKTTFYSLGKVTSVLYEKVCFSVIALKSLKSSLLDIFRTRLELKSAATHAIFSSRWQCNFKKLLHCRREEKIVRVACLALAMQHLLKSCRNIANS